MRRPASVLLAAGSAGALLAGPPRTAHVTRPRAAPVHTPAVESETDYGGEFISAEDLEREAFSEVEVKRVKGPTKSELRAKAWFEAALQEAEADYPARAPPVALASSEGVAALERVVLPSKKQEPWRFTRLDDLWKCAPTRDLVEATPLTAADIAPWLPATDEPVAVLVDGVLDAALSKHLGFSSDKRRWVGSITDAPPEVLREMGPLHASLPEVLKEESIPQRVSLGAGAWAGLNAACAADAVVVWVADDEDALATADARRPNAPDRVESASACVRAHVVHARRQARGALHARTVVSCGAGANAAVRESFVGFSELDRFSAITNARSTCRVGAGGALTHVLDGNEGDQAHIHHATAVCARDAGFLSRTLSDASALSRVCVDCDVAGAGAFFDFSGVQLGAADQNLDLRTALTHSSPDGDSKQAIRNVAAEKSRITFKGRIDVPQLGQRTNADQLCRSLVLDDGAAVDAMPSLEIVADDVKCTHGATVADLDEESIFYLESRGLSRGDARALLIKAFCFELVQMTDDMLPRGTLDRLDAKLLMFEERQKSRVARYSSI
jgi:Fe-S cluster assembly protein SufD